MQESLEVLRQYSIISPDEIQSLRHSILQSHPDLTEAERAQLFAKCLHQKLDNVLTLFDVNIQKNIKKDLLKQAVTKPLFSINVLDILETYTQIESITSSNVHLVTSWVNQYGAQPLTEEHLLSLTQNLTYASAPVASISSACPPSPKQPLISLSKYVSRLSNLKSTFKKRWFFLSVGCTYLILLTIWCHHHVTRKQMLTYWTTLPVTLPISLDLADASNYLHTPLQYKPINEQALNSWLVQRDSLLATEPYFSTIIQTAQSFDINPLLLFAITGQEQNFVPSTHESAIQIANNPFNLYGSWKEYNTSIEDSAAIVSRTIIRLGKDCPEDYNQIQWINHKYAADSNWHLGVIYFLEELEQVAGSLPHTSSN
ncbi:MAG: hypothetical protein J6F30_10290 [Cellulosilyticum sp.]|nr:hypothetical protein [Cellulosilyticum sp.]